MECPDATTAHDALQHGPRPLPLFLEMLRRETAASPDRRAAALKGLRRYQEARRPPPRPRGPVLDREGSTLLRDYGGPADALPIVFVPSLINPPDILDLDDDRSLLRWLAAQGHRVLMIDWAVPDDAARTLDLTGHVEKRLLPLLMRLGRPAILVGYCLGGTLALGAARAAGAAGVAAIAAPWRFSGYGEPARTAARHLWTGARAACDGTGLVPMELFQALFWQLDPARTIAKFEGFAGRRGDPAETAAFLRLEDWANAGAPLSFAAAEHLFAWISGDDEPGGRRWLVVGEDVLPARLECPAVTFVSRSDRIVPLTTSAKMSDVRMVNTGHVGMIIGRTSFETLWQPLQEWAVSTATSNP